MTEELLNCNETHLHVTGSISASLVPWWIHWLRHHNRDIIVNVSVTSSATRFVTLESLSRLANGEVWEDSWQDPKVPAGVHSGSSGDTNCFILFPATIDTLMRLAQGRTDTPALMMLQLTDLPIVIADTLPGSNMIIKNYLKILTERPNIGFAPRVKGFRVTDQTQVEVGFNLPGAISVANQLLKNN